MGLSKQQRLKKYMETNDKCVMVPTLVQQALAQAAREVSATVVPKRHLWAF